MFLGCPFLRGHKKSRPKGGFSRSGNRKLI
jgi:hypothetical protein